MRGTWKNITTGRLRFCSSVQPRSTSSHACSRVPSGASSQTSCCARAGRGAVRGCERPRVDRLCDYMLEEVEAAQGAGAPLQDSGCMLAAEGEGAGRRRVPSSPQHTPLLQTRSDLAPGARQSRGRPGAAAHTAGACVGVGRGRPSSGAARRGTAARSPRSERRGAPAGAPVSGPTA